MKLEGKHYAVIAALLTGVATQLLTAQHGWAISPRRASWPGLLIQVASAITAIFVGAPGASAAPKPPIDPEKIDPKRFVGTGVVLLILALQAQASRSPSRSITGRQRSRANPASRPRAR